MHRGRWTFAFSQRRERSASDVLKQIIAARRSRWFGSLAHTSSLTQADSRRNKGPKSGVAVLLRFTRVISVTPEASVPPKPVKVLVAEDVVLVRLMMADMLRGEGFQVFEASNGQEGISIMKTMPVDVVITDFRMVLAQMLWSLRDMFALTAPAFLWCSPPRRLRRSPKTLCSTRSSLSRTSPRTSRAGSGADTPAYAATRKAGWNEHASRH